MMDTLARIRSWNRGDVNDLKALMEDARADSFIKRYELFRAYQDISSEGNIENYLIEPCRLETLIGVDKRGRGLIEFDLDTGLQYRIYEHHHTSSIVRRLLKWLHCFVYDQIRVREHEVQS